MLKGHNQDPLYEHSLDHALEFFTKAGSLYAEGSGRTPYLPYGVNSHTSALQLFQQLWIVNNTDSRTTAMKLLFWLRDPRGGAGNRSAFRECIRWLATDAPGGIEWLRLNYTRIPEYGRFDDLKSLFGTSMESDAGTYWAERVLARDHYALKWAKTDMVPLMKGLQRLTKKRQNQATLRKLLAKPERKTVEQSISANISICPNCNSSVAWRHARDDKDKFLRNVEGEYVYVCSNCSALRAGPIPWAEAVDYESVPSQAMTRYVKAFQRHDPEFYGAYKEVLKNGSAKVNANVLFPHQCRAVVRKDPDMANELFKALPNYMEGCDKNVMVLADTSGSMSAKVGGSTRAIDVSVSLALYCSDRLGPDNPFYRKYMEFGSQPTFRDWCGSDFSSTCFKTGGYCGSTNIQAALEYILSMAQMFKATREQMINTLIIISDMQFDQHTSGDRYNIACKGTERTVVERTLSQWQTAGYDKPSIVFWNVAGYAGQPATCETPNTALVSGFSPSILRAILEEREMDSMLILRRAISKYKVTAPASQ